MELKLDFPPELEQEIRRELQREMFQTAIFLTIRQLRQDYNLSLKNSRRSYMVAREILRRRFPEFFPQMTLFM
ncbi:MAG: hypothetical protein PHN82_02370 [bacterium]|nr:hypothetical protein [bacterium]